MFATIVEYVPKLITLYKDVEDINHSINKDDVNRWLALHKFDIKKEFEKLRELARAHTIQMTDAQRDTLVRLYDKEAASWGRSVCLFFGYDPSRHATKDLKKSLMVDDPYQRVITCLNYLENESNRENGFYPHLLRKFFEPALLPSIRNSENSASNNPTPTNS